jgi:hypothetical protein
MARRNAADPFPQSNESDFCHSNASRRTGSVARLLRCVYGWETVDRGVYRRLVSFQKDGVPLDGRYCVQHWSLTCLRDGGALGTS